MFKKSSKGPRTLNPGKSCADCEYHRCNTGCMSVPREMCRGFCTKKHKPKQCHHSGKMCMYFKQIDWSKKYDLS